VPVYQGPELSIDIENLMSLVLEEVETHWSVYPNAPPGRFHQYRMLSVCEHALSGSWELAV
jgi:hypothetical protein